ncbi:hypothetical protein VOLCADRAFT_105799 [Volvox carteri f. nagariensis]|uniref:RRM domain-containing protein n=1 Tax=Volvox carteri f. nagariensis TaxID=3068 RepID=D8U369_VOLCA|nr:uncharacterized protein VOLCADRAFT_105799 [Volvox carteri f. nagariensis]EFJ45773.1 hypothetical protein VOLCADRAFT_105799 [Volvox carteri f. nagariensis]|eukprot:XP_002953174.1 hypothetical protein VOLCADRAFT_105799 [Volvox carteri f. nagariensis]
MSYDEYEYLERQLDGEVSHVPDAKAARSKSRSRDRSRPYSDHYRSSQRSLSRRRSLTPPSERLAREKERELRELERATRTVFAYNLSLRADERDIFEFFSKVGRVVDIRLITDKNTKKSRGLAYVEFSKVEEVISAVALTGNILKGQPVMVKASEAEKNMAWEAAQQQKHSAQAATHQLLSSLASSTGSGGKGTNQVALAGNGPCWLQVSNLVKELGEAEVQQLFAPFGKLEAVQLRRDATGRSTGIAYLKFGAMDAAAGAMAHWHGRKLVDSHLTVIATAPPTPEMLAPALPAVPVLPGLLPDVMPSLAMLNAVGAVAPGLVAAPTATAIAPTPGMAAATATQAAVVTTGELDEDNEGGGIKMSAQGRVALMTKLAGSAGLPAPPTSVLPAGVTNAVAHAVLSVDPVLLMQQGVLGPSSPIATPCLLLKNMFDAAASAGDAAAQNAAASVLAAEVEVDVREECSRFGELLHVWVDAKSKGFVYLRFATTQSAEAAHRALHGRWYSGRQILAEYQFMPLYNSHFKLQAKQSTCAVLEVCSKARRVIALRLVQAFSL